MGHRQMRQCHDAHTLAKAPNHGGAAVRGEGNVRQQLVRRQGAERPAVDVCT